jgi:CheY-like chemotaxis protein
MAHLKAEGLGCDLNQIVGMESLREALKAQTWDLLLTDYTFSAMDGLEVLNVARQLAPALPCVVLADQTGEEAAVEALRAGARDVVNKSRMTRLVPAI